jgi:uncharacterized OB-fold protein
MTAATEPATATPRPLEEYRRFLAAGRFMLQRARQSGRHVFYPRVVEPLTGATDLEWVEASGRGSVYSFTIVNPRAPTVAYNVALIDLAEGPRMMSRIDGIGLDAIRIGMRVRARIVHENGAPLVVFTPDAEEGAPS